tara:strand:- start:3585 stop:4022 length:438 start_codon:yes stop_codon:yes gene_type:complete
MDRRVVMVFVLVGAVVLIAAVYFTFFFHYKCDDLACFKSHQIKCSKTKFVNDLESTTWFYTIQGDKGNKCVIDVEILQVKEGSLDRQNLEGLSMECSLQKGGIDSPETDLTLCHGLLKEEIQELIIKNTHAQIVSNLEEEIKGLL